MFKKLPGDSQRSFFSFGKLELEDSKHESKKVWEYNWDHKGQHPK